MAADPSRQPTLRSDAERERARAERARRRAAPPANGLAPPTSPGRSRRTRGPGTRVAVAVAGLAVVAIGIVAALLALSSRSAPHPKPLAAPAVEHLLIPEGENRRQIAARARAAGLTGSYLAASRRSPLLDPASYGAPPGTPDLEGFLFPATYDVYRGSPASEFVQRQLRAFQENFGPRARTRARALHLTPYQLLIVASMVEREAVIPGDRAKIAAVVYNRLRLGMPLGIDATIYYAIEQRRGIATYSGELSEADLHIDSPYNTRTHLGLPPTPISNPGLASIEAAAHPAHVPYLYYVAGPDGCGEMVFSVGIAAFEKHVAAYQAAVAKNGGRPPVCKRK
ncbi:MAG TPA: endolytic transglycosylase MltG [Solirubrobacteraceae bacterium]|nr:endolytic transglycosylase MltG [Solirubrobacteraceae bacterium]